jgi:hypothetical protein
LQQIKLWLLITNATRNAQIYQHHQMNLHHNSRREQAQIIQDTDTGDYLNYCQLMKDSKHAKIWAESLANEFAWLAQGVAGRVKGTNNIFLWKRTKYHSIEGKM